MTAELSKAQEHARRFQELLAVEKCKQKGLKVAKLSLPFTTLPVTVCIYYVVYVPIYLCTQHALEQELDRQGAGLSAAAQRAYVETLSESLSPHGHTHGPTRVDDVIRKNEVSTAITAATIYLIVGLTATLRIYCTTTPQAVLVENRGLRAGVRRLRMENSELLRRVRFADSNAHYMRNQVSRLSMNRCHNSV